MTFRKGDPKPPDSGRKLGSQSKITTDVKDMVLTALSGVGGVDYLMDRARDQPKAFLALVGRIIPTQITGANGSDLIPLQAEVDPHRIASAILSIIQGARKPVVKEPVLIEYEEPAEQHPKDG